MTVPRVPTFKKSRDTWDRHGFWKLTEQSGREHARTGFTDMVKQRVDLSPVISRGDHGSVRLNWDCPRNRNAADFIRSFSIHSHPPRKSGTLCNTSIHFSGEDFRFFLTDPTQSVLIMTCGSRILLALKNSSTSRDFEATALSAQIARLEAEFLPTRKTNSFDYFLAVRDFTKTVCLEFGLSLYWNSPERPSHFERLPVA